MKTIRWFRIDGMTTPSSECTVRAALHALPGVERAPASVDVLASRPSLRE